MEIYKVPFLLCKMPFFEDCSPSMYVPAPMCPCACNLTYVPLLICSCPYVLVYFVLLHMHLPKCPCLPTINHVPLFALYIYPYLCALAHVPLPKCPSPCAQVPLLSCLCTYPNVTSTGLSNSQGVGIRGGVVSIFFIS